MRHRNGRDIDLELFELLADLEELVDSSGISPLLRSLLDMYGLKSIAYLGSGVTAQPGQDPYLAVTYSPAWVEHYKAERFVDVDPAIQLGLRRMLPIDWNEFDRTDKHVRRLFGEATEFGLGRHGISLPVHGQHGDRALISITSDATDRDWRHLRRYYMRDFQVLALHMHQAIMRLEGQTVEQTASERW